METNIAEQLKKYMRENGYYDTAAIREDEGMSKKAALFMDIFGGRTEDETEEKSELLAAAVAYNEAKMAADQKADVETILAKADEEITDEEWRSLVSAGLAEEHLSAGDDAVQFVSFYTRNTPATDKQISFIQARLRQINYTGEDVETEILRRMTINFDSLTREQASAVAAILSEQSARGIFVSLYHTNRQYAPLFGQAVLDIFARLDHFTKEGLVYDSAVNVLRAVKNPALERELAVSPERLAEIQAQAAAATKARQENAEKSRTARERSKKRFLERKARQDAEIAPIVEFKKQLTTLTENLVQVRVEGYELGEQLFANAYGAIYRVSLNEFAGIVTQVGTRTSIYFPAALGADREIF